MVAQNLASGWDCDPEAGPGLPSSSCGLDYLSDEPEKNMGLLNVQEAFVLLS